MSRGDLANEQWERRQPLLPPQKPQVGRPNDAHRRIVNGMLRWISPPNDPRSASGWGLCPGSSRR
ncbi:MAG TPA: hypothetical protein DEP84_10635 [Chloroflexi bacterium]|nr:hypothetical protein [Chloroflexota bacterium]